MVDNIKKILYIASNDLSRRSADVVNIMEMCNAFSKHGYALTLIVPELREKLDYLFNYYGIEFPFDIIQIKISKHFKKKKLPGYSALFSISSIMKIKNIHSDLVYTRSPWIFFLTVVLLKRVCFFESHQFRFKGFLTTLVYHSIVKVSVKSGNGYIVCISNELMKKWKQFGVNNIKIYVAHDGVNTDKFKNTISINNARLKLGLRLNQSIVVYTGSLIDGKGVEILIKAANRLSHVQFLIVGGTKEQINSLNRLVNNGNVIFVGHKEFKEVPLYQSAANILALPNCKGSVIDDVTSPIKLFEYFATQRPVVASDMPSLLEVLEDHYNALISPAGDHIKLAENINLLLDRTFLCERLAKNAFKDIEKYSWNSRVKYLSHIFNHPN